MNSWGWFQPQEFMNLEAFRGIAQQILQLHGGFWQMARVILRHRRLELMVEPLGLRAGGLFAIYGRYLRACQQKQKDAPPWPTSNIHGSYAITDLQQAGACKMSP
jgi:hypothetical protein